MTEINGEEFGELSRMDDERLATLFEQRRHDPPFLDALNEELKKRSSDEASDLHMAVVIARRAFPRESAPKETPPTPRETGPVRDWLRAFLRRRGLARPDGRSFHRYRMMDEEYDGAKKILHHLAQEGRLTIPDRRAGALFVAYCSEWFRRESDSTFLRWDDPAPDLFPSVPYASKTKLTRTGLAYWQRSLRMNGATRRFLLTLALEGGFPVRILAEGARGWLKDYLRSIMRRATTLRVDTVSEIRTIAEEERGRMRKSYQHDDFLELCSELVESLLRLRRTAEAEGTAGIRNSTLLDAKHPGWREELPIYLPGEDEALVGELLTGLLDEKMTGLATEGVETKRYLVKRGEDWLPAVLLLADGEIASARLPNLSGQGRVRAIPTGELGNHLVGELALLEPPVGEQRRWRVRPFMRTTKLLTGFPFTAPVTATLSSSGGAPCPWTWPRGEAVRSELLVFQQDDGSTSQEPLLRFLRAGSVSSPAKVLYALIPEGWTVEAAAAECEVAEIESIALLGRKLVRLTAAAYFRNGENDSVRFMVQPDTEARENELELSPVIGTGFFLADERSELVFAGTKPLILDAHKRPRQPTIGEVFTRRPGSKWAALAGPLEGAGPVEVSWRDATARIQIEKRSLVLVPRSAELYGKIKDARSAEICLKGLPGWNLSARSGSYSVSQKDASTFSVQFTGRPIYHLSVALHPPSGELVDVVVPLVGSNALVALADGSILQPGSQVDLGALRGSVAISPRKAIVHLAAKGSRSGGLNAVVDGELPLGILRSAIGEMLATLPGQDDLVELEFIGGSDRPIRISRYRYGPLSLDRGIVHLPALPASTATAPVVRMILDPRYEHALELEDDDLWRIPERCKGLCLVYLRDGVDVVSRPVAVPRPGSPGAYAGDLISAVCVPDYEHRQGHIVTAFDRLGRSEGEADELNWLLDAATNLNGLPPSAFDALKLLPSSPETLIRLLLNARDAGERGSIWSLQNELPFLWLALPLRAWRTVLRSYYLAAVQALESIFGPEKAVSEALTQISRLRDDLIALEPALGMIFGLVGHATEYATSISSLRELTSGYIANQFHRGGEAPNDLAARLALMGLKLPPEIATKSHGEFAGLFAPILLAATAQGQLSLKSEMALLARRTLREDPAYVSSSWCHLLKYYGTL